MLNRIDKLLLRLATRVRSEEGQALAEYSLTLVFILMVCVIALTALGLAVSGLLGNVAGAFP